MSPGAQRTSVVRSPLGDLGGVLRVTAQRVHDVAADDEECKCDETADADTPDQELRGLLAEDGIDVIDVDTRADDPAPGFEFLDVGKFRVELVRRAAAGLRARPLVADITVSGCVCHLDEGDEEVLSGYCRHRAVGARLDRCCLVEAVGIKHLAIQRRHRRVHDHLRRRLAEIVDPEILDVVVAY